MSNSTAIVLNHLKRHWFWPAAFAVVLTNAFTILVDGWHAPQLKEFGVLFDFAVLIPLLYWFCYRRSGKKTIIRTIGLACLGVLIASVLVPDIHHSLIHQIGWVRYLGLAVLVLIQIHLSIEIWRAAFRSDSAEVSQAVDEQAERQGVPPWVARLMAAEARFFKKLWQFLRRIVGR